MIIHPVEQNTDDWVKLRAGLPTASSFKSIITSQGLPSKSLPTYAAKLAADKYAGEPLDSFEGNVWTERGHELESDARDLYSELKKNRCKKADL